MKDFEVGDELMCISSASCAYTKGKTYEVYANHQGKKCLMGDDGLEDPIKSLVSVFKRLESLKVCK